MAFTAGSLPKAIQLLMSPMFLPAGNGTMMHVLPDRNIDIDHSG